MSGDVRDGAQMAPFCLCVVRRFFSHDDDDVATTSLVMAQQQNDDLYYMDHIMTPLNACSLETLSEPIAVVTTSDETTTTRLVWPVVMGCYELQEDVRKGRLALHLIEAPDFSGDDDTSCNDARRRMPANLKFDEPYCVFQDKETSGVLDGKWFPKHHSTTTQRQQWWYATACASGEIAVYCFSLDSTPFQFCKVGSTDSISSCESVEPTLCLSLNWDEDTMDDDDNIKTRIVSSYSDGRVAVHNVMLRQDCSVEFQHSQEWLAHTLFGKVPTQVWTACFASNYILSGGDDCKCKVWELSQDGRLVHVMSDFDAGVTVVSPHPSLEHIVALGSYDESVALYDLQSFTRLFRAGFGGGIWRIQWHPIDKERFLLAAMHGGCRVVQLSSLLKNKTSLTTIESIQEFTQHKSMAYGADWLVCRGPHDDYYEAAASCSFYDKAAYIWDTLDGAAAP